MALDTDNFGEKKHFPLPWFVFIITINWAAMAMNMYVGFLAAKLLVFKKNLKNFEYF